MGYSIGWDNEEKTVILQQYIPHVAKDDLYQLAADSARLLSTVPHLVHIIIDERHASLVANSADMQYLEKLVPSNEGVCVLVIPRQQFLYKTVVQKLRQRLFAQSRHDSYIVETIEDARALLQESFGVVYQPVSRDIS